MGVIGGLKKMVFGGDNWIPENLLAQANQHFEGLLSRDAG